MQKDYEFNTLGLMIDVSRNAVMSIAAWRKFLPLISRMGYNAVFLYMEDIYEVKDEPLFGYMRGRYSIEDMKEIDRLGYENGIEMIPCIQTLGHLTNIFRWGAFEKDTSSTLLVGSERTYQLIDRILSTLSQCFRTRRIHIGMDEAHDLGRGSYLDKNGYESNAEIMHKHLTKIKEMANGYGYELLVWSDMFFRGWNGGKYYTTAREVPKEFKDAVIDGVKPVYWDYYRTTEDRYMDMLSNHKQLSDEVWFAGGVWTWVGFSPANEYTVKTMLPAISACRKHGVKNIFFTLWGDNGSECPRYAMLPSLYYLSQVCRGNSDHDLIKESFRKEYGIDYEDMLLLDEPNRVSNDPESPYENTSPSKYAFYSDYLNGHLDFTVKRGGGVFYRELVSRLRAAKGRVGDYAYLFDTAEKLSLILADKYELGVKTREAYKRGDKVELLRLANEEYTRIEELIPEFISAFEYQWLLENNHNGFEIHENRIGGLHMRTKSCKRRLIDYAEGRLENIPELECEVIPYGNHKLGFSSFYIRHHLIFTSNPIDD